jgi:excisionase family DNA binding protein
VPTATSPSSELLTRQQAAAYLGIQSQTLAAWKSSGRYRLPVTLIGRLCRYRQRDLDAWLESRTIGGEPVESAPPPRRHAKTARV